MPQLLDFNIWSEGDKHLYLEHIHIQSMLKLMGPYQHCWTSVSAVLIESSGIGSRAMCICSFSNWEGQIFGFFQIKM